MAKGTTRSKVTSKDEGFVGLGVTPVIVDLRSAESNIMGCDEEVPRSKRRDVIEAGILIKKALKCLLRADPSAA